VVPTKVKGKVKKSIGPGKPKRKLHVRARILKKLTPLQYGGLCFLVDHKGRGILALDVGAGKTLIVLAMIENFGLASFPVLILYPKSVAQSWKSEIKRWLGLILDASVYHNAKKKYIHSQKKTQICEIQGKNDALVTNALIGMMSYEMCTKFIQQGRFDEMPKFKTCVLDESHRFQNFKCKGVQILGSFLNKRNIPKCVLMTGTLGDRTQHLWPQLNLVCPEVFSNWPRFAQRFCNATEREIKFNRKTGKSIKVMDYSGSSNPAILNKLMRKTCVFSEMATDTTQDDSSLSLFNPPELSIGDVALACSTSAASSSAAAAAAAPPNLEAHEFINADGIRFSRERWELQPEFTDDDMGSELELLHKKVLNGWSGLSKDSIRKGVKSAPFMMAFQMLVQYKCMLYPRLFRIAPLNTILLNKANKVILFMHHKKSIDAACATLKEMGVSFMSITGQTSSQKREKNISDFQTKAEPTVAVMSITATGKGVPFHAANHIIFLETTWKGSDLEQAEGRAVRKRQKRMVRIVYTTTNCMIEEHQWKHNMSKIAVGSKNLGKLKHKNFTWKDEIVRVGVAP